MAVMEELALKLTADYFKLRELRDALADTEAICKVLIRAGLPPTELHDLTYAMDLHLNVIADRFRVNRSAFKTMREDSAPFQGAKSESLT
jgi:hypothetical protein